MGLSSLLTPLFFLLSSITSDDQSARILYLMHHQKPKEALTHYLTIVKESKEHDFSLLQQAALTLLKEGAKQEDKDIQLMCLLASSICRDPSLTFVYKQALKGNDLQLQMAALSVLGQMEDIEADEMLFSVLSSPFLIIRLEALLQLARRGHADVFENLTSLFAKSPPLARPLFAQIISWVDTPVADRFIRQLLLDSDVEVRIETIGQVREKKLDQFLPQIRRLAKQNHIAQQESALTCLIALGDNEAAPTFASAALSTQGEIALAAHFGLYKLGKNESLLPIQEQAKKGNLFAINLLGKIDDPSSEEILYSLSLNSSSIDIRFNALVSLVQLKSALAFTLVEPFLFKDQKGLGFHTVHSPGRSFQAFHVVVSADQNEKKYPAIAQTSSSVRQALLLGLIEISEEKFITIAEKILARSYKELVPLTIQLLENIRSPKLENFLETNSFCSSSPFIRGYCSLALYRLDPNGKNSRRLLEWVKNQRDFTMIQVKEKEMTTLSPTALSYEETSQLFLEALEAISMQKNFEAIETLIHLIAYGNEKNRYALAGLLIKTAE